MKNQKNKHEKPARKFVVKNGLKFVRKNGFLVFEGTITNTIDHGFHSYSQKQRA